MGLMSPLDPQVCMPIFIVINWKKLNDNDFNKLYKIQQLILTKLMQAARSNLILSKTPPLGIIAKCQ